MQKVPWKLGLGQAGAGKGGQVESSPDSSARQQDGHLWPSFLHPRLSLILGLWTKRLEKSERSL